MSFICVLLYNFEVKITLVLSQGHRCQHKVAVVDACIVLYSHPVEFI